MYVKGKKKGLENGARKQGETDNRAEGEGESGSAFTWGKDLVFPSYLSSCTAPA